MNVKINENSIGSEKLELKERDGEKTIVALAPPVTSLGFWLFLFLFLAQYNTTYTILILHNNNKELNTIKQYNIVMKLLIISFIGK